MDDISLFHQPSFGIKIQEIGNTLHLQALFAAMFAYAVRFEEDGLPDGSDWVTLDSRTHRTTRFHNLALALTNRALDETPDQPASLCLLQAMALTTYNELIGGVQGRAWRLVGSSIRAAYELHLHLIDYDAREDSHPAGPSLMQWVANEERRRCWWALWKMDIVASTIKRCPTAIDSTMIQTYLPVSDSFWFNNQFQRSCFLTRDPVARGAELRKCGNESADAWNIVISSIMRDAQVMVRGNIQGVLLGPYALQGRGRDVDDRLLHYFQNSFCKQKTDEDLSRLKGLISALDAISADLPECLTYNEEYLDFGLDPSIPTQGFRVRRSHSARYAIFLALQLARFMIYHNYAHDEIVSGTSFSARSPLAADPPRGLRHCLQAADNVYSLISQCPQSHIRYVSPFLSDTVWLAAALQVLRNIFVAPATSHDSCTKAAILRTTYEQYALFWGTPTALLENLDVLETRLREYHDPGDQAPDKVPHGPVQQPLEPAVPPQFTWPTTRTGIQEQHSGSVDQSPPFLQDDCRLLRVDATPADHGGVLTSLPGSDGQDICAESDIPAAYWDNSMAITSPNEELLKYLLGLS
jgi:hypothetical protein